MVTVTIEQLVQQLLPKSGIPKKYWRYLRRRGAHIRVLDRLRQDVSLGQVIKPGGGQRNWELVGQFYRNIGRPHQALLVYRSLYERMIEGQSAAKSRQHKGMPLVWIADLYREVGYPVHARRYAMLTLIEDAIREKGKINPEEGGIYFRLAWQFAMSDKEIQRYARDAYQIHKRLGKDSWFPERILLEFDNHWMVDTPAPMELFHYVINPHFVQYQLKKLGGSQGRELEILAQYLLSSIPGFRTYPRRKTPSTDYDVVSTIEGLATDFRHELGRYIVCECKDWAKKVDFGTIAKFSRVLDAAKCKAGILFSRRGITGEERTTAASRERLKVYQDRGMVILSLNLADLQRVARRENLITLLRARYEAVRLDTGSTTKKRKLDL